MYKNFGSRFRTEMKIKRRRYLNIPEQIFLGPIYTLRLCRVRQVYDRPTTLIASCKSNLLLAYDGFARQKNWRRILKHVLKRCDNRNRNW